MHREEAAEGGCARIGVVVVNYGTDELTLRCLQALTADRSSPPTRIVLVDNGPGDSVGRSVRAQLPDVEVLAPGHNVGFGAACNLAISQLGEVDAIALVNSDVVVSPGWLTPLWSELQATKDVGATCPKVLFEGRYREVVLTSTSSWTPGRGDGRQLAWRLVRVLRDGRDITSRCQLVSGFWEPDARGWWAGCDATIRIPAADLPGQVQLVMQAPPASNLDVVVSASSRAVRQRARAGTETVVTVTDEGEPHSVINNVGNDRRSDGYGLDVGYLEVDSGQYDHVVDVPAWYGGAVLLRSAYLRDVGTFEGRFFLYYEDLDLALRGRRRGWRYQLVPSSIVHHRHGSSSRAASTATELLKERNRLLLVARHDGVAALLVQLLHHVLVTASYARRDVVSPLLRRQRPDSTIVGLRIGAVLGALRLFPALWRTR